MAEVCIDLTGPANPRLLFGNRSPLGYEVFEAGQTDRAYEQAAFLSQAMQRLFYSDDSADVRTARAIDTRFSTDTKGATFPPGFIPHGSVVEYLSCAPEDEIIQFSHWNVRRFGELQDAIDAHAVHFEAEALNRTHDLVRQSLFPKHAMSMMEETVSQVIINAVDSFEAAGSGMLGRYPGFQYDPNWPMIDLTNQFSDPAKFSGVTKDMENTSTHEHFHAAGQLGHAGFCDGIYTFQSRIRTPWVEEAFVEHATLVSGSVEADRPDTFSPIHRQDGEIYLEERDLLAILALGKRTISFTLLSEAFFESRESERTARKELETRLAHNFKELLPELKDDALWDFSLAYAEASKRKRPVLAAAATRKLAERLGIEIDTRA